MEESPKGKSLSKTFEVRTSGENTEATKGKRQYIAAITVGSPHANLSSKETMKTNVVEMLSVHKRMVVHREDL